MRLAWRLPRRIAYWCAIRVGAHATVDEYGYQVVPDLLFTEALIRWDIVSEGNNVKASRQ